MFKFRPMVLAIAMLIVGPIMIYYTVTKNSALIQIVDHGKAAAATIDEVLYNRKYDSYSLKVAFAAANGQPVSIILGVDNATGKAADGRRINTIPVRYLPEDPNEVFPEPLPIPSSLGIYVGAGVLGFGAIWLAVLLRRRSVARG